MAYPLEFYRAVFLVPPILFIIVGIFSMTPFGSYIIQGGRYMIQYGYPFVGSLLDFYDVLFDSYTRFWEIQLELGYVHH